MRFLLLICLLLPVSQAHAQNALLGAPEGGDIRDLVRAPDGTVYAGTARGGVFRSTDSGQTWTMFREGMNRAGVYALAFGPDGTLYAGAGRFTRLIADGVSAVYRLDPGATTWVDISGNLPDIYGLAIYAIAGLPDGVVLAGATNGLYRTTDGGATWVKVPGVAGPVWELFRASDGTVYLGQHGDDPVLRSDNEGETWISISEGIPPGPRTYVFGEAADGTIVTAPDQYYYTTDQGATWTRAEHTFPGGSTSFARADDDRLYAADGSSLVYSADGGRTWEYGGLLAPGVYFQVDDLVVAPDGELLLGTMYGGVIRSNHTTKTWDYANTGLAAARVTTAAQAADGRILAGGDLEMFASADEGRTWTDWNTGGLLHYSVAATGEVMLVGGRNSTVYRVLPDGTVASVRLRNAAGDIRGMLTLPNGRVVALLGRRVFTSDDAGQTWTETFNEGDSGFSIARGAEDELYIGRDDGLFRSDDQGETWTQLTEDYGTGEWIRAYAVAAPGGGRIYVSDASVIFRSDDGGATWTYSVHPPVGVIHALHVADDGTLWIGGMGGLFRSTDGGETIENRSEGLYDPNVIAIFPVSESGGAVAFPEAAGDLIVVTEGGGTFIHDPEAAGVATEPELPTTPALRLDLYPNPSVGPLTIAATLPEAAPVRVVAYDLLGRQVAVLHDGPLPAGTHTLPFDTSALAAGVYAVRIEAGALQTVRLFTRLR